MMDQGRAISTPTGAGFSAQSWLLDDGDLAIQSDAAQRRGFLGPLTARSFSIGSLSGVVLTGKAAQAAFVAACAAHDLVIIPESLAPSLLPDGPCLRIDRDILDKTGAMGGYWRKGELTLYPSRAHRRIWHNDRPVIAPIRITP